MQSEKYEVICELWLKSDTWLLEDALRLINKKLPLCLSKPETEQEEKDKRSYLILKELVKNNLNSTLTLYPSLPGEDQGTIRINPFEFLDWLEDIDPELVPIVLKSAKSEQQQLRRGTTRKERPDTIHRHRVAALAEYFWRDEPSLTKVEMAQKPELNEIGCNGKKYTPETIQRWIKESNPNREPGRRS